MELFSFTKHEASELNKISSLLTSMHTRVLGYVELENTAASWATVLLSMDHEHDG